MSLLLLHGAVGASEQLVPLQQALGRFDAKLFDFPGHGGKEFPAEAFSIRLFAESVLAWMDAQELERTGIFGYSMGGYVGLYLARHYPQRIDRVLTVATKFAWDETTAAKEVKMLDPGKIAEKVPKFAQALEKRHAPLDWKEVLQRTAQLMLSLGREPELKEEDFKQITQPVRIALGDRDTMVSLEETVQVYRALPNAQLQIFPQTPHPVEQMNVKLLVAAAEEFFQ